MRLADVVTACRSEALTHRSASSCSAEGLYVTVNVIASPASPISPPECDRAAPPAVAATPRLGDRLLTRPAATPDTALRQKPSDGLAGFIANFHLVIETVEFESQLRIQHYSTHRAFPRLLPLRIQGFLRFNHTTDVPGVSSKPLSGAGNTLHAA